MLADDQPVEHLARELAEHPDVLITSVTGDGDHTDRLRSGSTCHAVANPAEPIRIVAAVGNHLLALDERHVGPSWSLSV
jgi:hypothetical protein